MFDRISITPVPSKFLVPHRRGTDRDMEWGGLVLQDSTGGLYQRLWECYYRDGTIYIYNGVSEYPIVIGVSNPTYISLAFDINMNYNCTYIQDEVLYFKWYDTITQEHITTSFPNITSAYATLDDGRVGADGWNDIVLFYSREDKLYYRLQRDRYTVEYLLADFLNYRIFQAGMTSGHRLQLRYYLHRGD